MKSCNHCQKNFSDALSYCPDCGRKLEVQNLENQPQKETKTSILISIFTLLIVVVSFAFLFIPFISATNSDTNAYGETISENNSIFYFLSNHFQYQFNEGDVRPDYLSRFPHDLGMIVAILIFSIIVFCFIAAIVCFCIFLKKKKDSPFLLNLAIISILSIVSFYIYQKAYVIDAEVQMETMGIIYFILFGLLLLVSLFLYVFYNQQRIQKKTYGVQIIVGVIGSILLILSMVFFCKIPDTLLYESEYESTSILLFHDIFSIEDNALGMKFYSLSIFYFAAAFCLLFYFMRSLYDFKPFKKSIKTSSQIIAGIFIFLTLWNGILLLNSVDFYYYNNAYRVDEIIVNYFYIAFIVIANILVTILWYFNLSYEKEHKKLQIIE